MSKRPNPDAMAVFPRPYSPERITKPNPGNIGNDFGFFGFSLWDALHARDPANQARNTALENLNVWRNAIAHQSFTDQRLDGRTTVRLLDVRYWRRVCEELATQLDAEVGAQIAIITGASTWEEYDHEHES